MFFYCDYHRPGHSCCPEDCFLLTELTGQSTVLKYCKCTENWFGDIPPPWAGHSCSHFLQLYLGMQRLLGFRDNCKYQTGSRQRMETLPIMGADGSKCLYEYFVLVIAYYES